MRGQQNMGNPAKHWECIYQHPQSAPFAFCFVLFYAAVFGIVRNTKYAIERKRGGAWTCAGQIEAIGISVNAYPHPKSSPLAFFPMEMANPSNLGANMS